MTTFLMNAEVEAHICLAEGKSLLRYTHPAGKYTVFIRDLRVTLGSNPPLLSVQITYVADSLQEAKGIGTDYLKEFLDYLVVVTNNKFKLNRIMHVFNWEPGAGMRECMYYAGFANHDVPEPALNDDLLKTVSLMQELPVQPRLRRALKWFANGVGSTYPDDQFAYFWFVIEIIAQVVKEPSPVPDRCPACKGALFCPECGVSPLHKPYPKQAIKQLFSIYVGENWEPFYTRANDVRNRLLHGDDVATIEAALGIELPALVDNIGQLAWTAIANQFTQQFVGKNISFLQVNRYVHLNLNMGARMQVGLTPNFADPNPKHFPEVKLSMVTPDAPPPQA